MEDEAQVTCERCNQLENAFLAMTKIAKEALENSQKLIAIAKEATEDAEKSRKRVNPVARLSQQLGYLANEHWG